jgi:hypothetical protein
MAHYDHPTAPLLSQIVKPWIKKLSGLKNYWSLKRNVDFICVLLCHNLTSTHRDASGSWLSMSLRLNYKILSFLKTYIYSQVYGT